MTEVKICGVNSDAALAAALDAGADYIGLVLYPPSPRALTFSEAAAFASRVRADGRAKAVTLVVDPDDDLVRAIADDVRPHLIQLHGHETSDRVAEVCRLGGLPVIKALGVATRAEVSWAKDYLDAPGRPEFILYDARPPARPEALPGGNGLAFDWRILDVALEPRFALAGGLTPDNVAEAIRLTGAPIVDVSSGVETAPGRKDPDLIRRFLRAAKAAKQSPNPA